jgi:hypothetical protein
MLHSGKRNALIDYMLRRIGRMARVALVALTAFAALTPTVTRAVFIFSVALAALVALTGSLFTSAPFHLASDVLRLRPFFRRESIACPVGMSVG